MSNDSQNSAKRTYTDPQQAFRDSLESRYPGRFSKAKQGSKVAKIELQCIECVGGSVKEAIHCESRGCFLWDAVFKRDKR